MGEFKKLEKIDLMKCQICGVKIVPDKKAVIFGVRNWDKHSYKFNCDCNPENIRISSG